MTLKQWVNLPKKDVFKDDEIDSLDRCGEFSIEVEIENIDQCIPFKVNVVPVGSDNVTYTDEEEKRNPNFKATKAMFAVADQKTTRVDGVKLLPAGGNKYKIEVEDVAGDVVSTNVDVESIRRLYYQKISMKTGSVIVPSYSFSFLEKDSLQHYIEIVDKGSEVNVPYMKTIMTQDNGNNLGTFGNSVASAFNIDNDMKKVGMAAVFSDYLASKGNSTITGIVMLGDNGSSYKAALTRTHLIVEGDKWLWHGLDDTEDQNKAYFIDGAIKYTDINDSANDLTYLINRSDVDLHGAATFTHGGYMIIEIAIQPSTTLETMSNKKSGIIEAELDVRVTDGWTNGFSWIYSGIKLITCARRVKWEDMPNNTKEYTWNHEVGHRFGMTAWGDATYGDVARRNKLPDAPGKMYYDVDGKNYGGHRGPHCGQGVTYDEANDSWSGTPGCVMFGSDRIGANSTPKSYCNECEPIVRKLDLSS